MMKMFDTRDLVGPIDWSGPTFGGFANAAVKLRWIDSPFEWHRNDGAEVFVVLDGQVDMHVRRHAGDEPRVVRLGPGQLVVIEDGEEHVAHPRGEARILVVEQAG
jgi:mannose-6-phosphate isomerase-like protein (cupin superfamily)